MGDGPGVHGCRRWLGPGWDVAGGQEQEPGGWGGWWHERLCEAALDSHGVLLSCDPGVLREVTTEFTVDARSLTSTGGNHVTARVLNPSGAKTDTYVTDNGDGTYRVQYTAYEEGEDMG